MAKKNRQQLRTPGRGRQTTVPKRRILTEEDLVSGQFGQTFYEVPIPEHSDGAYIRLQALNASEIMEMLDRMKEQQKGPEIDKLTAGMEIIAKSMVDDDGNRIQHPDRVMQSLMRRDVRIVTRLAEAVLQVHGIGPDGLLKAGRKNDSGGTSTGDSPSVSPPTSDTSTPTS